MKKNVFLMLILALMLVSSVQAKTIIWVTMAKDADQDNENDSKVWADKLEAEGYTIDFQPGNWDALTQEKLDLINEADLVIVSCTTESGTFATDDAEIELWNSVEVPMMLCSPYIARSTRWDWIDYSEGTFPHDNGDQGAPKMKAVMASHPVFFDVTVGSNNQIDVIDPDLSSGNTTFCESSDPGNGTLIAETVPTSLVQDWSWIIEWQEGVKFYSGSAYTAAAHRMYFTGIGAHEVQNSTDYPMRGYNLTDEGWKVFFNAVQYMLGDLSDPSVARRPHPANGQDDVLRTTDLWWTAGSLEEIKYHDLYFGTNFEDVNTATIDQPSDANIIIERLPLDQNYYDLATNFAFGQTYYWRVDEVNEESSEGINRGDMWSFQIEPEALTLPSANITASAIASYQESPQSPKDDPNATINGSGLRADNKDLHSDDITTMWLAYSEDKNDLWIRYDFDKAYKLHEMLVWNYNLSGLGFEVTGFKKTLVEYSVDGVNFMTLSDVPDFNMAPAEAGYKYNTIVDFNDVIAKSVRLTCLENFNEDLAAGYAGLSEVRFMYIPVRARNPKPNPYSEDEADYTGLSVFDTILSWRAGRESALHDVYLGTDPNALVFQERIEELAYSPTLDLNRTYYWRIDEVNENADPALWQGNLWDFSTQEYVSIDDFEDYNDNYGEFYAVFDTWYDGYPYTVENGGSIGYPERPTEDDHYLEGDIVQHGAWSAPFRYRNTSLDYSEVTVYTSDIPIGSDWSIGNPDTMVLWFRGDPNNYVEDQSLYVRLNEDDPIYYDGDIAELTSILWTKWEIPLEGIDLDEIDSLTIGVEKIGSTGGEGQLLLDHIYLTNALQAVDPGTEGLIAKYDMENNVKDKSGNGHDGTLKGTVNGGPKYVDSLTGYGKAMIFDGNDDCVDLGKDDAFNPAGSFSVSLWANVEEWSTDWGGVMIANRGENNVGWQLRRPNNNNFCFTTRGVGSDDFNSNVNLPLNEWINITCVYDSEAHTKTIYFDGNLIRTVTLNNANSVIAETTHNTYIGARANNANDGIDEERLFKGMLDNILLYDRALSEAEVKYIYKN